MSNNGAALLGGLLIGGLVVGAAMSAENAANRQQRRNMRHYHRQHPHPHPPPPTYCICGERMMEGRIQRGVAKCNNLNCQKILTGNICYYCPKGANCQQHRNGFFYCQQCALQVRRQGNKVIRQQQARPQPQPQPHAYPAAKPVYKKQGGGAYIIKQGYMSKKGNWFNTGYKKRWFKLWSNKKMAYLTHPGASYTKGYADFTKIKKMEKKGKHGFEVHTAEREWSFLCQSEQDRNEWFDIIQSVCMGIQKVVEAQPPPQPQVKYVPAVQPQLQQQQVQYVPAVPQQQPQYVAAAVPAMPNNGNHVQQPLPQQQPMYRGSVIQQPSQPQIGSNAQQTRPNSQSLQPGMVGYNGGDMYGGGSVKEESKTNEVGSSNIGNNNGWEVSAPPAAYMDASAPSAPPEDEIVPSAPPMDEPEGQVTQQ